MTIAHIVEQEPGQNIDFNLYRLQPLESCPTFIIWMRRFQK